MRMKKLIELLNEYGEYDLVEHNGEICKWTTDDEGEINIYTDYTNNIISKKFGFIQWLVEHNKLLHPNFVQHLKLFYGDTMPEWNYYIMMLSIADSPIAELNKMLRPY